MDVLFVGGVVGAVFFLGSLIAVIASAGRARTGAIVGIATIFMIGTTEGVWAVGTFDFASFSFIALLLLGAGTARPYEYRPLDASRVRQDSSSERRLAYPRAQV
jgi:hypothetical protein